MIDGTHGSVNGVVASIGNGVGDFDRFDGKGAELELAIIRKSIKLFIVGKILESIGSKTRGQRRAVNGKIR
mgnify:CR=1 FL=1